MANLCWFANQAQIQLYTQAGTIVNVGALKNVKFSPKFEIAELRGMDSIMRQCIAKYNYDVDVSFEYAMWDPSADIILYGMLQGRSPADTNSVGTVDDTSTYRNTVATFQITATMTDTSAASKTTATAYSVYFTEIPWELRENEYISRNMTGKAKGVSFYSTTV